MVAALSRTTTTLAPRRRGDVRSAPQDTTHSGNCAFHCCGLAITASMNATVMHTSLPQHFLPFFEFVTIHAASFAPSDLVPSTPYPC